VVATRWALQRDKYGIPVKILEINNDITERVQAEQELRESESLIRALYQVTTNLKLSFNERLHNLLDIGCQYFGLDFGLVAQVKGDWCEVIAAQSPDNVLEVGYIYDVNQRFCLEVLKQEHPFSVQQASNSQWRDHPGYTVFRTETYIGTKILVQGKVYGILCFSSGTTSSRKFRDLDKELLKLMAQWIGSEIERYSAAQALEQLQHHNELILNSAGEGICGVDSIGNITFVNPAAANMLGYTVEELINQPIHAMLSQAKHKETPHTLNKAFLHAVLKDGTVQHFKDQVFWRKDGSSFPAECIVTPMQERKARELGRPGTLPARGQEQSSRLPIVGAVVTFRDITERLAVERMKDEFISVVSHELRTPLTAIRGSLGLIAGGLLTTQPQKAQRMLEIAAGNTDRLTRLINDILDIERMESGKVQMEKEVCNVHDLMVQTADDMRTMADKAGITLVVAPIEAQIRVDRDRIIQVLTNLISNAIKFSPPNTTVELIAELQAAGQPESRENFNSTFSCAPVALSANSKQILFKVKDQGRGIPTDKLESIFGRFQQVNASDSRDKGGTGLGLAICRSIVQQHDGYIWAESKLGEGSTLCFTLPALPISRGVEEQFCPPVPQPPLVLLCDDETSIRVLVTLSLESQGYRVVAVASGEEVIEQAALLQPSVILLDLLMPGMSGWEALAVLKEQPNTQNIPIIIFSAWASEEDKSSHPDVANWLSKPLTEQVLVETIQQSLKQRAKVTRVLVVEDDLDLAGVLTTMFERHGIEAYHAQTGREAIQLSQHVLPDLLLLDLVLPEGDGYTVVEWLRLYDYLHEVPLVVYSAEELTKAERDRLALGPTEFFTKGRITPEDFEQRVIALLNRIVTKPGSD
jgi:PAS domain S-box-containing protein